ncbi:AbrB/MazE/SpoVT family DNA-binding domain-containing protein (plasmid) [Paenibacillus peoriae]|uniref:AbrB/MazE/SpoVT family DNA-binding domain-containing protein n=1 Tax=Paenibacillus peoriae TaxID=59893 RepID=UPI0032B01EE3
MMYAKMTRDLDTFGRLVIPKAILTTCDIVKHATVEIFVDEETSTISLKKYIGHSCKFCHSTEELSYFKASLICKSCVCMLKIPSINKQVLQPKEMAQMLLDLNEKHSNATQQEYADMLGISKSV